MKSGREASRKTLKATSLALSNLGKCLPFLDKAVTTLKQRRGDIIVTGIGKSSFIAQKFVATLTSLGVKASFLHPVDAMHGDLGALSKGDVLVAFSASGESREVLRLTEYAKKHFRVPVISFVCRKESTLANLSEVPLIVEVDEEGSPENVAPMASTTSMLVLADMLASHLVTGEFKKESFARLHPGGSLGLELSKIKSVMKESSPPAVSESSSLKEVLKEINKKHLGVTAVLNKSKKLIGAITDGDIRRSLSKDEDLLQLQARDLMSISPKSIQESATLKEALVLMEKHKITTLFVVDGRNTFIGIVHMHDIVENTVI